MVDIFTDIQDEDKKRKPGRGRNRNTPSSRLVDIFTDIRDEDKKRKPGRGRNRNTPSSRQANAGNTIQDRLGFGGPTKSFTQTVPGEAVKRIQGGQGGDSGTASDGILLGGNNQQNIIDNTSVDNDSVDTGNQTVQNLTRLGSTVLDSGRVRTDFRDAGGTASLTTSPGAAQRLASGRGQVSGLDFSGARAVAPGARAELAALQRGQRLGLDPRATLSLAEDARINALPPGPEKEIALVTKQRDDGELHPAVAQARLNQLFQRQTQRASLAQEQQQADTSAEVAQQRIQSKQFADQQAQQISAIKDANKSSVAANKARLDLFKFAQTQGVDRESEDFKNQVASIGIASVSGEVDSLREAIRSGQSTPDQIKSEVTKLRARLKTAGFENITEEQFKRALIEQ